jgi:hypothetical protein
MRRLVIASAIAVLFVAICCMAYLGLAAIAPDRAPITDRGITEVLAIATAAPAAALALLTIALVVANFRLAEASQALARLTAQQRTEQWEPLVTARLDQAPGAWPRSVALTNLATGPAIDCVYVATFKDSHGLGIWHVTNPIDLLQGAGRPLALNRAHGFDRMEFVVSDTGEVDPQGRPLRRRIRRTVRAFSADDFVTRAEEGSRHTSHVGRPPPSVELFTHKDGTQQIVDGRQEAVICTCANGHVHRTLPHLRKPTEQFQPDDPKVGWLNWYINEARYGIPMPDDATLMRPEPDPVVISRDPT